MKKAVLAIACVWGTCQPALAADEAASAPAKTDVRMERAKRDATNPLRIIIEAAQVKARPRAPDLPATAAPTPAVVPVAAQAAAPRAAAARPATAVAEPTRSLNPARAAAEPAPAPALAGSGITERVERLEAATAATTPAPAAKAAPAAEPPAVGAAAPASAEAPAAGAAALALSAPAGGAPAVAPGTARSAESAAAATALDVPLKLVQYIEPEIPQRLRARLRTNNEVTVGFTVNRDGSVSDVSIRATTNRALDQAVLEAVRQWRYGVVPEPRENTVQLVFNLAE